MSNVNIFKIKMVQPNCIQNRLRGVVSNQLVPKRKQQKPVSVFFNQSQSLNNNTPHKNSNNTFKDNMDLLTVPIKRRQRKQSDTYRSQRSASFVRSHRAYKKTINQQPILLLNNLKLTKQRPQSAMLKKSRKRSWEQYKNKLPLIGQDDIFFRKNQELTEGNSEQYVAFYKKKGIFVRVIKSKVDWDWEPINNQYVIKIFGRISIRNQMYFIVQNFNNTSIRDIINCFGPCKESLVKKQIRSLVCGVIHCHNRGFVHNRLNPDNIYMNKEGNFLIDIVKSTLSGPTQKQKQKYYHYFSPELLKENISAQSCDVWGIGCLTLQILTGKIKTSILHPYHQSNQASPTSTQSILRQIKQQSQNYIIKQNLGSNEQILNNKQTELSKSARSFIAACLKVNYKTRPELSILIDHDFLRLFS